MIEDDRDIALGIRTVLTRSGFDVANSADGRQGLRTFHDARPDLVVLDIGLPTLDGWSVLERIRDLSDVPVLILTAHGSEADKVRGLHGGADDYLTKPFGNRELAARVEALLRRPRTGCRAGRGLRRRQPAGPAGLAGGQRGRRADRADPDRVPAAGRADQASRPDPERRISCWSWPGTTRSGSVRSG